MVDSDYDVENLLKDVDNMDDALFGKKKDTAPRRGLTNIDDLLGDPQKEKKSKKNIDDFFPTKKSAVSFLDELSGGELQQREQAAISRKNKTSEHHPNTKITLANPTADDNRMEVANKAACHMDSIFGPISKQLRLNTVETSMNALHATVKSCDKISCYQKAGSTVLMKCEHMDYEDAVNTATEFRYTVQISVITVSICIYSTRRGTSSRTGEVIGSSATNSCMNKMGSKADESGRTNNDSDRFELTKNQRNLTTNSLPETPGYNRMQRLENETDRLNREIDSLKRKQTAREEALVEEWKEKLKRRDQQFEEELENMEDNYRNYEEMLKKVDGLVTKISELTINLNKQVDKSNSDQNHYISFKEQQLEIREERIRREEEWLTNEKQHVIELNLKLQSESLKQENRTSDNYTAEKWQVREERQKLNTEKEVFKNEQLKILDAAEQQKIEIEASKSNFLRQQHDLLLRVMAAKSSLEAEKSAFDAQRDRDVARLKMEAEQLDHKLREVQNAEDILQNTQRIYEQKYQQLVVLERALIDECFELERCRKQLETIQSDMQRKSNSRNEQFQQIIPLLDVNAPDLITDPYIDEMPNRRENENYNAILKIHAGTLECATSQQSLNTQA
uniref:Uncharacterized protein n=1 Tax=Setaria digitata TaxID=48799 RepID=A0A915PUY0_9BILA